MEGLNLPTKAEQPEAARQWQVARLHELIKQIESGTFETVSEAQIEVIFADLGDQPAAAMEWQAGEARKTFDQMRAGEIKLVPPEQVHALFNDPGDPLSNRELAMRLADDDSVRYELALIALAAESRRLALEHLEKFPTPDAVPGGAKFHEQAKSDLARAEAELQARLETWRAHKWQTDRAWADAQEAFKPGAETRSWDEIKAAGERARARIRQRMVEDEQKHGLDKGLDVTFEQVRAVELQRQLEELRAEHQRLLDEPEGQHEPHALLKLERKIATLSKELERLKK